MLPRWVRMAIGSTILDYYNSDSSVGIATGCRLDGQEVGVRVPVGSRIFSSPRRPNRIWGPPRLQNNGYRRFFPQGYSDRSVTLSIHLQLVLCSRIRGPRHPLPYTSSWRSESHAATDGQSINKSWRRPLWREDGSVFCICCWSLPA
jgi:hypothetical protein